MVAGPQMISAVFFATSENWKGNSAAYILGAALSITAFVTVAYFVARGATSGGGSTRGERSDAVNIVVLVLLVFVMVYVFLKRNQAEPPKWMGRLQTATVRFSFILGLLLLGGFRPTSSRRSPSARTSPTRAARGWTPFHSSSSPCCFWRFPSSSCSC